MYPIERADGRAGAREKGNEPRSRSASIETRTDGCCLSIAAAAAAAAAAVVVVAADVKIGWGKSISIEEKQQLETSDVLSSFSSFFPPCFHRSCSHA